MKNMTKISRVIFLISITILFSACGNSSSLSTDQMQATVQAVVKTQLASTAQASETETTIELFPTQTPEPLSQLGLYILITNQQSDQSLSDYLALKTHNLANQKQTVFEHHQSEPNTSQPIDLAVFLSPAGNPILFAETHPNTQILAVGYENLTEKANIIQLAAHSSVLETNFAAGLLSSMIADNWRTAILTLENENSKANAFIQGVKKICGVCSPPENDNLEYPLYYALSSASSSQDLQNAINQMRLHYIDVVYLTESLITPEIEATLVQNGFQIVGEKNLSSNPQNWLFAFETKLSNTTIDQIFTQLSTGEEIYFHQKLLEIKIFDTQIVSQGKINKMNEILEDFNSGFITIK